MKFDLHREGSFSRQLQQLDVYRQRCEDATLTSFNISKTSVLDYTWRSIEQLVKFFEVEVSDLLIGLRYISYIPRNLYIVSALLVGTEKLESEK